MWCVVKLHKRSRRPSEYMQVNERADDPASNTHDCSANDEDERVVPLHTLDFDSAHNTSPRGVYSVGGVSRAGSGFDSLQQVLDYMRQHNA
jgi:hypothetical protein